MVLLMNTLLRVKIVYTSSHLYPASALSFIYSCGGPIEGGCISASTDASETLASDFSFE